jgi:zinc protease
MGACYRKMPTKLAPANLLAELMMEGTASKTSEQLQDAIGQLGAAVNMTANAEYITLSGNCLARNFEAMMVLVTEILLEPRWDAKEFDRIKNSNINRIRQQAGQPNAISGLVFNKLLYGHDNILSNSPLGTVESVERITLDDLKNYYSKNFSPGLSTLHVVGAVTPARVKQASSEMTSRWPKKEVALAKVWRSTRLPTPAGFLRRYTRSQAIGDPFGGTYL